MGVRPERMRQESRATGQRTGQVAGSLCSAGAGSPSVGSETGLAGAHDGLAAIGHL